MANDASLELQKAVKTTLEADTTLQILMGGSVKFFDHVPENETFPYIVYRDGQVQEWDTDTGDGKEHTVSLNAWSDYEGVKVVKQILNRVYELVQNNTSFVLVDHNLVNMRLLFTDTVQEPDGQTFHSIAQYRAITEET